MLLTNFLHRVAAAGVLLLVGILVTGPAMSRLHQHLRVVQDVTTTLKCGRSTTDSPRVRLRVHRPAPLAGSAVVRVPAAAVNGRETCVAAADLVPQDCFRTDPDPLRAPPSDLFV